MLLRAQSKGALPHVVRSYYLSKCHARHCKIPPMAAVGYYCWSGAMATEAMGFLEDSMGMMGGHSGAGWSGEQDRFVFSKVSPSANIGEPLIYSIAGRIE